MNWKEAIRLDVIQKVAARAGEYRALGCKQSRYQDLSDECPALLYQCGLLHAFGTLRNKSNSADWIEDFSLITIAALHRAGAVRAQYELLSLLKVLTDQKSVVTSDVFVTGNTLFMHVHRVTMLVANHMKKEVAAFMPKSKEDAEDAVAGTRDEPLISAANTGESTAQ